jgi:hypothetical protein
MCGWVASKAHVHAIKGGTSTGGISFPCHQDRRTDDPDGTGQNRKTAAMFIAAAERSMIVNTSH